VVTAYVHSGRERRFARELRGPSSRGGRLSRAPYILAVENGESRRSEWQVRGCNRSHVEFRDGQSGVIGAIAMGPRDGATTMFIRARYSAPRRQVSFPHRPVAVPKVTTGLQIRVDSHGNRLNPTKGTLGHRHRRGCGNGRIGSIAWAGTTGSDLPGRYPERRFFARRSGHGRLGRRWNETYKPPMHS